VAVRLWRGMSRGLSRLRWPLAGLAALVVIVACVLVIPQWLVRWELGAPALTLVPLIRPVWLGAAAMDENRGCPAKLGFPWCERAR